MRFRSLLPALLSLSVLSACGSSVLTLSSFDGSKTAAVTVEVVDSPSEREQGMMNRTKLDVDTGMLFAFPEPAMLSFWMKNTNIPLEVLFFDVNGEFVSAAQMVPCTADPCAKYKAQAASKYALEVNSDFRKAHDIGVGWKLSVKQLKKISRPK